MSIETLACLFPFSCLRTLFVYTYTVFVCHYERKQRISCSSLEMKREKHFIQNEKKMIIQILSVESIDQFVHLIL